MLFDGCSPDLYPRYVYFDDGWTLGELLFGRRLTAENQSIVRKQFAHRIECARAAQEDDQKLRAARCRSLDNPALTALADVLWQVRDALRPFVLMRPLDKIGNPLLKLKQQKRTLDIWFSEAMPVVGSRRAGRRVRVSIPVEALIGWAGASDPPLGSCSACATPRCLHRLRAIDAALISLLGLPPFAKTQRGFAATLAEFVAKPAWARTLDSLVGQLPRPKQHQPNPALMFRIDLGQLPLVWSWGPLPEPQALDSLDLSAGEREAYAMVRGVCAAWQETGLARGHRYYYGAPEVTLEHLYLLRALVDSERVVGADGKRRAVEVVEGRLVPCRRADVWHVMVAFGDRMSDPRPKRFPEIKATDDGETIRVEHLPRAVVEMIDTGLLMELEVPKSAEKDLATGLLPLCNRLPLEMPVELKGESIRVDPEVVLRAEYLDGRVLRMSIRLRLCPQAPLVVPGVGDDVVLGLVDERNGEVGHIERDLDAEVEFVNQILDRHPHDTLWDLALEDPDEALDFLARMQEHPKVRLEWPKGKALRVRRPMRGDELALQVVDEGRFFQLTGGVAGDDRQVRLALLLAAIREDRRYVEVKKDTWAKISSDLEKKLRRLQPALVEKSGKLQVSVAAESSLEEVFGEDGVLGELEAHSQRWLQFIRSVRESKTLEVDVPATLQATLRPYQVEGFRWLTRLAHWGAGACIADDMGLGKTMQALAILLHRSSLGPALVVAPTSVCFNWMREAERFAPSLHRVQYRGNDRERVLADLGPGSVLVLSYALMTRDIEVLAGKEFASLVFDEAHALKNPATHRCKAALQLQAKWVVGLTGTPLENRLSELWSVARVVMPGLFGGWEWFRKTYAAPIEGSRDEAATATLRSRLRPFLLRRTKREVARELPLRSVIDVPVELGEDEMRLYEEMRLALAAQLAGLDDQVSRGEARLRILAVLTRLRMLCCHPVLVEPSWQGPASKLRTFGRMVRDLVETGHRALVFSQFVGFLELVTAALDTAGIDYHYLDGSTPAASREERITAFQAGEKSVFVLSLKAGGLGVNLTGADTVIHLDPWWNPAVEDQASDRAHRIGQTQPVTIYRLYAQGTIEDRMLALHHDKRSLVEGVLSGASAAASLTAEDLMGLVAEPATVE